MLFICNNSLVFDPGSYEISLIGQPESAITLSAPAVRLLQEFIRNKGCDLSREILIKRVWEEFGFTPSGNNLNKAVSEIRKTIQSLGDRHEYIITVPRFGFRFESEVSSQLKQSLLLSEPENTPVPQIKAENGKRLPVRWKKYLSLTALFVAVAGLVVAINRPKSITAPATLKPVAEKIGHCRIWLINDHGRPLVLAKMAPLLEENNVACQREAYDVYYFSARFTIAAADEVFIGACPLSTGSLCKTIRFKSGAEQ
ncbi:transcriptional regulator [Enterobacteriaceae bacterium 89]|nr:transcriptional regulator [Enterobacteriaceae bacterium 89]